MHQLIVNNIEIDVVRKDIKNMHLAVYPPTGRIRIAVPLRVNDDSIKLFVASKMAWIKRNQRNFKNQERQSPYEYVERESHYFLGKRYLLQVVESEKQQVILKNKATIQLFVKSDATIKQKAAIMNGWYRKELNTIIIPLLAQWTSKIGVEPSEWQIRQMKTKWGSCNTESKKIILNLELARKPLNCVEYILVHELIHLLERYHNDNFLALMDMYLPNWRISKRELNSLPFSHSEWEY
jgi:predicted metal-dependent hydrolase